MHRIKARITSLHATESLKKGKKELEVQITIATICDYSVIEVDSSNEKKTV